MRVDRATLGRGAQLVLLFPSLGFAAMALMGGTAGVLGGMAAAAGVFGGGVDVNPEDALVGVYLRYILFSFVVMLAPALGYSLLVLLIAKGAAWMAARPWLAVLTLVIGADACAVATWLALDDTGDPDRWLGPMSHVFGAMLLIPVAIGLFNIALLMTALVRKRSAYLPSPSK